MYTHLFKQSQTSILLIVRSYYITELSDWISFLVAIDSSHKFGELCKNLADVLWTRDLQ